jgi:queuine/archaeosine tRNA-ribosyltransferase
MREMRAAIEADRFEEWRTAFVEAYTLGETRRAQSS